MHAVQAANMRIELDEKTNHLAEAMRASLAQRASEEEKLKGEIHAPCALLKRLRIPC